MRAAVYARLSRKKADDELGLNIGDQQMIGRKLVMRRGWDLIPGPTDGTFTDDGKGAYQDDAKRPAWEAMLETKPDVIVVRDAARLGRNFRDHAALLQTKARVVEWLDEETADVRWDAEPVSTDTEAFGTKTIGNRTYSQKVGRGVRRKIKLKAAEGAWPHGGTRAFGYHDHCCHDGTGAVTCKQGTIREDEAPIVLEFAERWLSGETLMKLCRELAEKGIRTPTGGNWQYARLRQMLSGPRIAGIRTYNGVETKGTWEPIVPEDLHRRLVSAASESLVKRSGQNRSYLLSGIVKCPDGHTMYGLTQNKRARYVCRETQCGQGIAGTHTDDFVASHSFVAILAPELRGAEQARRDLGVLIDQQRDLETRIKELDTAYWQERTITKERWASTSADLSATLEGAKAQAAGLKQNLTRQRDLPQTAEELGKRWAVADVRERNRLLRVGVEQIVIHPAGKNGRHRFDPMRIEIVLRDGQRIRYSDALTPVGTSPAMI